MEKKRQMIEVAELELRPIAADDLAAVRAAQTTNEGCTPDDGGGGDSGSECSEWWCLWYPGEN